jgi:hypothetical protein
MKWLIIIGVICFVIYQNQQNDKQDPGDRGSKSTSSISVNPENQTLEQILKGNLVNYKGKPVAVSTTKKYLVLYNGASW